MIKNNANNLKHNENSSLMTWAAKIFSVMEIDTSEVNKIYFLQREKQELNLQNISIYLTVNDNNII